MAHLRVINGPVIGHIFDLRRDKSTIIGRSHSACDIVLDHYSVSRQHARLDYVTGAYYIEDLHSYNHTIVNGKKIPPGSEGRRQLFDKDTIEINGFKLIYEDEGHSRDTYLIDQAPEEPPSVISTHDVPKGLSSDSTLPQNAGAKLKTLLTIGEELEHAISLPDVLPKILDSLLKSFPQAQCAFAMLRDNPRENLRLAASLWRDRRAEPVRVSQSIIERCSREKQAILTADASDDSRFGTSAFRLSLRSTMCVPLKAKDEEVLGVIQLSVVESTSVFTEHDMSVLIAVARLVAIVIENSRLHGRQIDEQKELNEELRRANAALKESESLYKSFVDAIPLCVARKDAEGRFVFANRMICEMLGRTRDELLGKTDYDISSRDLAEKYREDDERVRRTGETLEFPEIVTSPLRGVRYVRTLKTPTFDSEQRINGTQLIFWDVTDTKLAEEEIKRYAQELERSNRELEQFAQIVSHDLQSPLRTITNYCQLLKRRYASRLDEEFDEFSGYLVEGTSQMQRLIGDLLTYSRVTTQTRKMQITSAEDALESARAILNVAIEEHHAQITFDPLPSIYVDGTQLVQLFQNLIDNAIKYRSDLPPVIHVQAQRDEAMWQFSVRDNGMGFDMKYAERVFVIFQRLCTEPDRTGSGVGLAICKRIVERHGGRIWVESAPGKGTTFFFTIPFRTGAA